jgi:hypothetical protein
VHESYVTWDKAFGGHPTELRIMQYAAWSEVVLLGGGRRDENGDARLIDHVPIEVLRRIVAMHDALPPMPRSTQAKDPER